jgi:acyl carrier protein
MTHAEVMERLNAVFRDVFDDESIVVSDQTTADDIEDWDSLEHINLIEAVEQEFRMQFQMKEVSGMKNVGEMADIIATRATAQPKKKKGFFHF